MKVPSQVRHIIPISGKDSLATAIVQTVREPDLPYEYLFCDVRMELPETYAWLDEVEKRLGLKIVRVGKSLRDVIAEQNMLPSHQRRFCTKYGKVFPIQEFIGKDEAIQYLGIRADEDRPGGGFRKSERVTARYPLIETGIDLPAVYSILDAKGLQPPSFFWKRLYEEVYETRTQGYKDFLEGLKPWATSHLFSWRSRSNCFMCFYQRQYEWVGLLEHHPDLFEEAEKLEYDFGNKESPNKSGLQNNFYWVQDMPLATIRHNAEEIYRKRVRQVVDQIVKARHGQLRGDVDMLSSTSCGAYCGK